MADNKYYDPLDQAVQEASTGGIISQIAVFGAFEVYCSLPPGDRTFLYSTSTEKAVAREKAQALAKETGKSAREAIVAVQYKDTVLGRDVSQWKGDLYRSAGVLFGPDAKTLNSKRIALGLKTGVRVWARMGTIVSPNAEANKDNAKADWAWDDDNRPGHEGEKQLKRLHLPVEVFSTKEEAAAAAESGEDFVDTSDVPEEWTNVGGTVSTWINDMVPTIKETYETRVVKGGQDKDAVIVALANMNGVLPTSIATTLGVEFTGKVEARTIQ